MVEESDNWKQVGDVIKTEGNILEIGSFIARSGNKVDISAEDADRFYNNIDTSLPFVILHSDGYREEIGYATDFVRSNDGIAHKGLVFNNNKFKEAIAMGYNSISPEVDFETFKIERLAFVPNPAMKKNKVNMTKFAFSAPEVNPMTNTPEGDSTVNIQGAQVPTSTFVQQTEQPSTPAATIDPILLQNIAASIADGVASKFNSQIEALTAEITALKEAKVEVTPLEPAVGIVSNEPVQPTETETPQTIPQEIIDQLAKLQADNKVFQEKLEKEKQSAYKAKLAELRTLGQDSPEKLVAHLKDTDAKIETLDALKVAIIKNKPMNSPNDTPLSAEGGKNQPTQPTVLGLASSLKMSIDAETATRLSQKLRIPVQ